MSSLRQLASTSGLSITTVSRALDGYPDVAAATRQRVIDAAKATNYRPHAAARRLRLGSTETVTMVIPGTPGHFDEPLYLELLTALGARFDAAGFDLTVLAARDPDEERAVYQRLVEGRRTDGLIVARTRRERSAHPLPRRSALSLRRHRPHRDAGSPMRMSTATGRARSAPRPSG